MLLCTVYRRFRGDYIVIANAPRRVSPGLRFIKQNVPEVEILEYPMWREYVARLREGWDVVGFSFYQNEIGEIRRMVAEARRHGVREIWAGNYGALDYSIPSLVDRVFIGPAEDEIAQVFGYRVRPEDIQHPVMMVHFSLIPGIRDATFGLLYTAHGCPYKCSFCQTPVFERHRFTINLESIERVLRYYKKLGVTYLFPMDELFGIYPEFTDKLTRLFARYKFRWWAQSRASLFVRYLDTWHERGLRIPSVGVESMLQTSLDGMNKRQNTEEIYEFCRRSSEKHGMYRIGYFMTGHEDMTAEQTLEDAARLKQAGFDAHAVSVITPFPQTPLWDKLSSRYGIFDHDYSHYKLQHLVWNHPHISPAQMHYLQNTIIKLLVRPIDFIYKGLSRLIWGGLRQDGAGFIWRNLIKGPIAALFINDRKQVFF
ncbi:MAG: radical SAM protein [Candidatus Stahlbacteria bacterium]|nr:MAG: radical SAM protein [Candidatus Stahlbacteria bacterium]